MHETHSSKNYYGIFILYAFLPSIKFSLLIFWFLTVIRSWGLLWICIQTWTYDEKSEISQQDDAHISDFYIFIAGQSTARAFTGISVEAANFAKHDIYQI